MAAKRIFIAIGISDAVRQAVVDHQDKFRRIKHDGVRWERPDKIHLTLKFIGDFEEVRLPELSKAVEKVAKSRTAFQLMAKGTGSFPSTSKARVLWLGIAERPELTSIHNEIDTVCTESGIPGEMRKFHPHLTIARIKLPNSSTRQLAELHDSSAFGPIEFPAKEITIFESSRLPAGSVFQAVSKHQLK